MRKEMEKTLLKMTKKVLDKEIIQAPEWPPSCVGILHQPKRPKVEK